MPGTSSNPFAVYCPQHKDNPSKCFEVHYPNSTRTKNGKKAETDDELRRRQAKQHMVKQGTLKEITPGHGVDCVCPQCSGKVLGRQNLGDYAPDREVKVNGKAVR